MRYLFMILVCLLSAEFYSIRQNEKICFSIRDDGEQFDLSASKAEVYQVLGCEDLRDW